MSAFLTLVYVAESGIEPNSAYSKSNSFFFLRNNGLSFSLGCLNFVLSDGFTEHTVKSKKKYR